MIDYLWLDIEGPEYRLLPQFYNSGEMTRSITICQMNIELHGPLDKYNMTLDEFYALYPISAGAEIFWIFKS